MATEAQGDVQTKLVAGATAIVIKGDQEESFW